MDKTYKTIGTEMTPDSIIREYFTDRDAARGKVANRVVIKRQFLGYAPGYDVVKSWSHKGETVYTIEGCYEITVTTEAPPLTA